MKADTTHVLPFLILERLEDGEPLLHISDPRKAHDLLPNLMILGENKKLRLPPWDEGKFLHKICPLDEETSLSTSDN
jgi:hypothetical protein